MSEVLFGLIMVLTFTGSLSVVDAGREDIREMLVAALGCNLAWGIIDAVFYLMSSLAEKSRSLMAWRALREGRDPEHGRQLVADALPPLIASVFEPAELDSVRERLALLPEPPARARIGRTDWHGAIQVFLLVFLSTLPVALPFLLMHSVGPALRTSNAIAVALLFVSGYVFGRITGRSPALVGSAMVLLGLALVGLTIALGG